MFTLTFDTVAVGADSPLTLSANALGDASGNAIDATVQDGSITIASSTVAAPEPRSGLLLALGLVALLGGKRLFAARRQARLYARC